MPQDDALSEPLEGYKNVYKDLHLQNTENAFDELLKASGVDGAANKRTTTEYYHKLNELEKVKSSIAKARGWRLFLIILSIILVVFAVAAILSPLKEMLAFWAQIVCPIIAIASVILFLVLIFVKINPKLKQDEAVREQLEAEAQTLLNEAWTQMAGLNALYDWDIPQGLVSKTLPVIEMDDNFDEERYACLREKYGLLPNDDTTCSTQFCQSGAILGNPFLIVKDLRQTWVQQTYTGTLTIHWTETVHTKEGTRTVHRSQTLYAHVTKPKPDYNLDTYLVYGNDAAPNLSFSREPSGMSGRNEKQIDRMVAAKAKKLDKKARKAVSRGENYTRLGNDEFEAIFGGTDRDNEVEYRMLFTPLAQKNLLNLIKTPRPFGDDFQVRKQKKLNFVRTAHAQRFDYEVDPVNFINFDLEKAKSNFISINTEYFKSLYFDLAPLMSIPLYQQHKSREFIYGKEFSSNVSCYEHESIANSFQKELLRPQGAATPSILKTQLISKEGDADSVLIAAHAFRGERRVTYVSVWGGDGRMHAVPVVWIEYIPIQRLSQMALQKKHSSRADFNANRERGEFDEMLSKYSDRGACLYERGIFAMLTLGKFTASMAQSINSVYGSRTAGVDVSQADLAKIILAEAARHDRANKPETEADSILNDETAPTAEVADDAPEKEAAATSDLFGE